MTEPTLTAGMDLFAGPAHRLLLYILYIPVTAWEGAKDWKSVGRGMEREAR